MTQATEPLAWTERTGDLPTLPPGDPVDFARACGLAPASGTGRELGVYVARDVVRALYVHGRASRNEEGGILLGRARRCAEEGAARYFVDVARAIPARGASSTSVSFRFGTGTWAALRAAWRASAPELELVGWYHTHPNLGAFYSGVDRETQRSFFRLPWQVGIVIDPVRRQVAGFAGPESAPVLLRVYEAIGARAAPRCEARARVVGVGRQHEIALELGGVVRLAGVVFPPASGVKPARRFAALTRCALSRAVTRRTLEMTRAAHEGNGDGCAPVHFRSGGLLVAVRMLRRGFAWLAAGPELAPFEAELREAEAIARRNMRGVWRRRWRGTLEPGRAGLSSEAGGHA